MGNSIVDGMAPKTPQFGLTAGQQGEMYADIAAEARGAMADADALVQRDINRSFDEMEFAYRTDQQVRLSAREFNDSLASDIRASVKAPEIRYAPEIDFMAAQTQAIANGADVEHQPFRGATASGVLAEGRASMHDYWQGVQDNAVSEHNFLKYAGAGLMRSLGDLGYSAAETGVAIYDDPDGALTGAGKALVNFGPEAFNGLTNLAKTSLGGLTLLAENTVASQGTFAGFRESDPFKIDLLAPYSNQAEEGGAFLANLGLGAGLAKYGDLPLQSPLYLDLQPGAVAYSGLPIGLRGPFASAAPVEYSGGEFSIVDFSEYPDIPGMPRPGSPARMLQGDEYISARAQANAANSALRAENPELYVGKQIHEVLPVKFGGDPVNIANKVALSPTEHYRLNAYFMRLQRYLEGK